MERIINIGRLPPPIGGVSYFLKRFMQHLNAAERENVFIDISNVDKENKKKHGVMCMSLLQTFFWLFFTEQSIVIFHSNRFPVLVASYFLSCRHKIIIFTHGESILNNADRKKRFLLSRIAALVAPIEQLAERIKTTYPEYVDKIYSIPFILFPPKIGHINQPEIQQIRHSHKIMLSAYAYDIAPFNGIDLYGVDMLVDLMYQLRDDGYDVGMVLVLPACSDTNFAKERLKRIQDEKLNESLLVFRHQLDEAIDLFALSDIYLRPSASDGDSFAVWEALYAGTPVVVSDVVARPNGCRLFQNRNQANFVRVTEQVIENYLFEKKAVTNLRIHGSEKKLLSFLDGIATDQPAL